MHQPAHDPRTIVDVREQHGLVAQRESRVRQFPQRHARRRRHLARVVEVGVDPEGLVPLQHGDEFVRDAVRQDDGHPRPDSHDFHVRNSVQLGEYPVQVLIRQHERIAAR